jgi:hypothetical protein
MNGSLDSSLGLLLLILLTLESIMLAKLHLFPEEINEDKVKDGSPEDAILMDSQPTLHKQK